MSDMYFCEVLLNIRLDSMVLPNAFAMLPYDGCP